MLAPSRFSSYKQQKFNLLREESEGYSKLVVELLSSMGPPHSTEDGTSRESEAQRSKRAQSAIARVKNLIGALQRYRSSRSSSD